MDEKMLFSHHGVYVSPSRLVVNGQAYEISDITSFKLGIIDLKHCPELLCILLGLALLFTEGALFLFGGFSVIAGVLGFFTAKSSYSLIVVTADGEKRALFNHDRVFIEMIMRALDIAMASHRPQHHEDDAFLSNLALG